MNLSGRCSDRRGGRPWLRATYTAVMHAGLYCTRCIHISSFPESTAGEGSNAWQGSHGRAERNLRTLKPFQENDDVRPAGHRMSG
ncbi:hypothetical protein, partial [Streptomyces chartreusis]|uniref:hypothetical protein n=1 Tax=Streptomyces chartreusis TaxID=1969 RepID=UPI00340E143A